MLTIYELPVDHFDVTAPLFNEAWFDEPYMDAVLKGRHPGRIFVDDPVAPSAALMCRTYEYYVAGNVQSPLRTFIKDAPAEPEVFQKLYGYAPVGDAWETAILDDYAGALIRIPRHNFRWQGAPLMDWHEKLPLGAQIVRIDRDLAERIDREWHETIGLLWDGYDNYLQHGYGFCLMMGEELGSFANSDGLSATLVNIGVQTGEKFRRQGLAKLVCSAFIEYTLKTGRVPTWDTDGMNERSRALASSLGFVEGRMFSQLSTPDYKPIVLSQGLWSCQPGADGLTIWTRA
ncbi:MAG: GNAT family N-acetyltransferase [Chloroflexota bacterium]